jgi:hypothetical protein
MTVDEGLRQAVRRNERIDVKKRFPYRVGDNPISIQSRSRIGKALVAEDEEDGNEKIRECLAAR